ncbi:MAG TPA: adenosylcobinamide-phosphate synthase CbiB [Gemmataceae bacterium]|nr:adenosylcobinamide-phosphate synthase CbiB [Gemmataceae bacterium]
MLAATASAPIVLGIALLVDCLYGEYPSALHPVVWLGTAIAAAMRLAPRQGRRRQFVFGSILALGICGLSAAGTYLALYWLAGFPILEIVVGAFFFKASFALWELKRAADRVVHPLQRGDLCQAREALRSLCSRDPSSLDETALLAAVLESLAENLSDSFIAPLCYGTLFGVPGAMGYRSLNTLDAMIGYRGHFEFVGKASARLDDLANWIPARLTAGLLLLAGCLTRKNVAAGCRVLRRDGAKTPSPNGGRPMAALAGLLGVELEKKNVYLLGDRRELLTPQKVREAWLLVSIAGTIMAALCGLLLAGFVILTGRSGW